MIWFKQQVYFLPHLYLRYVSMLLWFNTNYQSRTWFLPIYWSICPIQEQPYQDRKDINNNKSNTEAYSASVLCKLCLPAITKPKKHWRFLINFLKHVFNLKPRTPLESLFINWHHTSFQVLAKLRPKYYFYLFSKLCQDSTLLLIFLK